MAIRLAKLGAACRVKRGTTITRKQSQPGNIPVVAGGLTPAYTHSEANRCADTITVSGSGANAGFINFYDVPIFASDCSTIFPNDPEALLPLYVYRFLQSKQAYIFENLARGAAQPHVYAKDLSELILPIPALSEQHHIVAILDEAFAAIATASANAEKNLANALELFEITLTKACTGELTTNGRGNHQSGSSTELIANAIRYRKDNYSIRGHYKKPVQAALPTEIDLPTDWKWASLDEICSLFVDSPHRTPKYSEVGIPALRPRDIVRGRLAIEETARVSEEEYDIQTLRYKPQSGDIVYSRELSYGWAATVPDRVQVCLSQGMCLFRPAPYINASFFMYVINGPIGRNQAQKAAVGAAHPHINLGDIKAYGIPIPPEAEQNIIVTLLDNLTSKITALNSLNETKLMLLADLKQSLLHKAFTGELTGDPKSIDRALSGTGV